jgi:SAM-dependent methyltransferase
MICSVCGNNEFKDHKVLWPRLIAEWGISADEVAYIDRQQGTICTECGANLRGVALGHAICEVVGSNAPLREFVKTSSAQYLRILDLNGTAVSDMLSRLPGYTRGDYPEIDIQALPYSKGSFDIVIHSDTLEHVPKPIDGLKECRRVLSNQGSVCYTVPIIVGRMTRSRAGLQPSYHGYPDQTPDDFIVHTEFGVDAWTHAFLAGFSSVKITAVCFPAAIALTLR